MPTYRASVVVRRTGALDVMVYRIDRGIIEVLDTIKIPDGWPQFMAEATASHELLGSVDVLHIQAEDRIAIMGKLSRRPTN